MKLVFGVGINDLPKGGCSEIVNGKQVKQAFYIKWQNMLQRCYSSQYHIDRPSYIGCSVCDEWKTLSKFKEWFDHQPLERHSWCLDKDLLFPDNKTYSPETCTLVPNWLNLFITDHGAGRGEHLLGVGWHKHVGKFHARINTGHGSRKTLGYFTDELEAHLAWKSAKLQMVHDIKDELDKIDRRIYPALIKRYS